MKILIVEDDPVQFDFIEKTLRENKEFSVENIKRINTESEFRNKIKDITKNKPDVIIMDVMLRWADPSPEIEIPPKEILEQGFYRAGIRCIELLTDNDETRNIPVIIYSILDKDDLENDIKRFPQAKYLFKDFESGKIINLIRSSMREKKQPVGE